MLNILSIHGRLTADPELKETNANVKYVDFCVAVDRSHKSADGTKKTDFFNCTAWRGVGEFIAKYFHKGQEIGLRGSMESYDYVDKEGVKRKGWNVAVSEVDFCGSKRDNPSQDGFDQVSGTDDLPWD